MSAGQTDSDLPLLASNREDGRNCPDVLGCLHQTQLDLSILILDSCLEQAHELAAAQHGPRRDTLTLTTSGGVLKTQANVPPMAPLTKF